MNQNIFLPSVILFSSLFVSSCTYTFYKTSCNYPVTGAVTKVSSLPGSLAETSGLETVENKFVSFNDSGGEPVLYFFNDHHILQKTIIGNVFNNDWEDIAIDDHYCYVADIGNNIGLRDTIDHI